MDSHTFSVSEVFSDGRVLIATYVRVGQAVTMRMDVYKDATLLDGERHLDVHLNNTVGPLNPPVDSAGKPS